MFRRTMAATAFVCSSVAVTSQDAQDRATVQLRNGTRVEGRVEALAAGVLVVRVSLGDQRRLPLSDVALIDRRHGASSLSDDELREARGAAHLLFLVGGSSVKGRLLGIKDGEGYGEDRPKVYIFRTFDAQERRYGQSEVARVYLGTRPFDSPWGAAPAVADLPPRTIRPVALKAPPSKDRTE